jgi:uncharacterized membrane protein
MTTSDLPTELKIYLRRLGWGLSTLSSSERQEILDETRDHILDRMDRGASLDSVLSVLGPAEYYARRFLDEAEVVAALASQRPMTVLGVVLRRVHRSTVAGLAVVLVAILVLVTGASVVTCFMKPYDPQNVGLWIGPSEFLFGRPPHSLNHHEVLGNGIYPFTVALVVATWFLSRLVLLWALKRLRP